MGGFFQTNSSSFGEINGFLPIAGGQNSLVYTDFIGSEEQEEGSSVQVGAGYRHLISGSQWMWGAHSYYELSDENNHDAFQNIIMGGELNGNNILLDGNVYLPIGARKQLDLAETSNQVFVNPDGNVFVRQVYDLAMTGVAAEVGYRPTHLAELKTYLGAYYFDADGAAAVAGPSLRASYEIENPFSKAGAHSLIFETGVRYNVIEKVQWYLGVRLRLGSVAKLSEDDNLIDDDSDVATVDHIRFALANRTHAGESAPEEVLNPDGSPFLVKYIYDRDDLNDRQANVLMAVTDLNDISRFTLGNNQVLTGGDYSLNYQGINYNLRNPTFGFEHGNTIAHYTEANQVDQGGFLTLAKNNTIDDLNLTVANPNTENAIANADVSVGVLGLQNITANGRININIGDGSSDSTINLNSVTLNVNKTNSAGTEGALQLTTSNQSELTASLSKVNITTAGGLTNGIVNQGEGSHIALINDSNIITTDNNATGIFNGSGATITTITSSQITTSGNFSSAIMNNGTITTIGGNSSQGLGNTIVINGGGSRAILNQGSINLIAGNTMNVDGYIVGSYTIGIENINHGIINAIGRDATLANTITISHRDVLDSYGIYNHEDSTINLISNNTINASNDIRNNDFEDASIITDIQNNILFVNGGYGILNVASGILVNAPVHNTVTSAEGRYATGPGLTNFCTNNTCLT